MKKIFGQLKKFSATQCLNAANGVLCMIIVAFLGYLPVKYYSDAHVPDAKPDGVRAAAVLNAFEEEAIFFKPKPFAVYAKGLQERDLFRSIQDRVRTDRPALKKALPALHKRIKLIGILLDEDSKAIVEDLKEKQTHFLSRGESLGTVFLEDIQEDKVIFMYNNERVEMTP
jgi:hypothetical protein